MSLLEVINKFYSKIWSLKKKYSLELWNAVYENILDTLQKEIMLIEYKERILLL